MKFDTKRLFKQSVAIATLFCMVTQTTFAALLNLAQVPLFIGVNIPPQVMLTVSKDQQLYKKAYNDYTDLDGDGQIETTYKHSIDYYGYFDPTKCYVYNNQRFEPFAVSATKYCTGQWSGNFLNWVSMSRMDAVRKLLYGGMRSTDQTFASGGVNAVTVLERAYLPMDAHAWAKHYNGADIALLTPFTPTTTLNMINSVGSSGFTIPAVPLNQTQDVTITFNASQSANIALGDQIRLEQQGAPNVNFMVGAVLSFPGSNQVRLRIANPQPAGSFLARDGTNVNNWRLTNLTRTGISFCNLTLGTGASNGLSQTNTNPPLIRVAQGNFTLWNANERFQCYWSEEKTNLQSGFGGIRSNGNQASLSEIAASAENPSQTANGLGTGNGQGQFNVRVQACVTGLFGNERCKQYPNGNFKPIGLLQQYGDVDLIQFGLMTGSYRKNISGGVLRKNVGTFTNEVNVTTDGTFTTPAVPPGSPRATNAAATPAGIVNTLNYLRIWGYQYASGDYLGGGGDNCTYQLTNIVENDCTSWGNPMSEIYFESLRYFAGKPATAAYTYTNSGSKDNQLGLPQATFTNPLNSGNFCAPLNVVVFNASVSTNDDDLRTASAADINSASTAEALTNAVGTAENITGNSFFAGKIIGGGATPSTDPGFELCTPKLIPGLGQVSGICPEGPTLAGSYLIAGLAHQARTNRIRTDLAVPASDTRSLKVATYGIQLATNVPQLTIPVPGSTTGQKVVIQPIYRLVVGGALGGGALVDMKFVRQQVAGSVASGKVYMNWEDSEQGGDYDQDMWGTLEWVLDAAAGTITVTTDAVSASTANPQGFGYTVSGTSKDGPHFHSGILGFNYTDATGVLGCTNCQVSSAGSGQRGPQSVTYTLGATTANTLQDPLWYAAKFGSFVDSDGNNLPDLQSEWDSKLANGGAGQDGVPDNYFLVTNPLGLEAALDRAFINILATATAASVATNSTSLQTTSTIYQARFNTNDWSGQVLAFGVQPDGTIKPTPDWDAGDLLKKGAFVPDARTVVTFNTTAASRDGVPFRLATISPDLLANLNSDPVTQAADGRAQDRLEYLRGAEVSSSAVILEGATATSFRPRPVTKLGDIVNSNPNFVGAPNAGFGDAAYAAFRQTYLNRKPMIYVGGNDGMLHAFHAPLDPSLDPTENGKEYMAYIPSKTFRHLNKLTNKGYQHRFYVDGSPEVGDAFIDVGGTPAWRTVLVGALGAGGQGLFALDVTDPEEFKLEANAANTVLWEFNDSDDPNLGYVMGQPVIRKMANGKWAAIVSGGYNNSEGTPTNPAVPGEIVCADSTTNPPTSTVPLTACTTSTTGQNYLYIIFLDGPGTDKKWDLGTEYIRISTGVGSVATPNGLAAPLAADVNADGVVDFIYAGDLQGNLFKFDVRSTTPSNWTSATSQVLLFTAMTPSGSPQPITGKPEGTLHPTGQGFIITFGTGKYLEPSDPNPIPGSPPLPKYPVQTFYGIWDKNDTPDTVNNQSRVTDRAQLLAQTIDLVSSGGNNFRVVSTNVPDWSGTPTPVPPGAPPSDSPTKDMGWFMDFPDAANSGERSVFRPILTAGRLIFTTLIPNAAACESGGTSFLMVVDPTTGARIDAAVLDTGGDGKLQVTDKIDFGGVLVFASGVQSTIGITPTPTIVKTDASSGSSLSDASKTFGTAGPPLAGVGSLLAYALSAGSSGGNASTVIGLSAIGGRVSWREILAQ